MQNFLETLTASCPEDERADRPTLTELSDVIAPHY